MITASDIPIGEQFSRHIICVTGTMAAGKNAVSDILARHGYLCLDADKLVHQVLALPDTQQQVLQAFEGAAAARGISLTTADGTLDRRALGTLLFSHKALLAKQEALVHPKIDALIAAFIAEHPSENIVLNAAVLYKVKSLCVCDTIFFVTAPLFTRLRRAVRRDNLKKSHILARFWQQRNLFAKYKNQNADVYKVSNTGTIQALEKKVATLLEELKS